MRKNLNQYLRLPYTIEINYDSEAGLWFVKVRELRGCMTQAERWEDILPMIEEAKAAWLESALAHGDPITEPLGVPL